MESSDAFCCFFSSILFPSSEDVFLFDAMFFLQNGAKIDLLLDVSKSVLSHNWYPLVSSPFQRSIANLYFQSQRSTFSITNRHSIFRSSQSSFFITIFVLTVAIVFSIFNRFLDHSDRHSRSPIDNLNHSDCHSQSPIDNLNHSDRHSQSLIVNLNHSDRFFDNQS